MEHFSSPAVKSTKRKLDADLPTKHWWIIDPVAQAIDVAAQLSLHEDLAFASVSPRHHGDGFVSGQAIKTFIAHVNRTRHVTGLAEIPAGRVTPHMFRWTMAMLTRDYPGSEIAVAMQLKHSAARALANRTTQGYMDYDPSWARHLDDAIAERRFERLKDLFDAEGRGEPVGYGPGADRMREAFSAVRYKAEQLRATNQAKRGDVREDATVPAGHRRPLLDRCQPARCPNSVIGPEHLPLWSTEKASLARLPDPSLPPNRRRHLDAQLQEVNLTIKKAGE